MEQRLPACHQLAHGDVAGALALARIETAGFDRDEGLPDEPLVALERAHRRLLTGRVAVEGEDDLAAELVLVAQQPAQDARVVLPEGRTTRGHGRSDTGEGGRP